MEWSHTKPETELRRSTSYEMWHLGHRFRVVRRGGCYHVEKDFKDIGDFDTLERAQQLAEESFGRTRRRWPKISVKNL